MKKYVRSAMIVSLLGSACFLLSPAISGATNLVANGAFQTGDFTGWNITLSNVPVTATTGTFLVIDSTDGFQPSGCCAAAFGAAGSVLNVLPSYDSISQVLTTTPGQKYALSFYLQEDGGVPGDFQVRWDSYSADFPATASGWVFTPYTFVTHGTGTDTLSFFGYNNNSYYELTDVSLVPVPEPSSILLVMGGLAGLGGMIRRKISR